MEDYLAGWGTLGGLLLLLLLRLLPLHDRPPPQLVVVEECCTVQVPFNTVVPSLLLILASTSPGL